MKSLLLILMLATSMFAFNTLKGMEKKTNESFMIWFADIADTFIDAYERTGSLNFAKKTITQDSVEYNTNLLMSCEVRHNFAYYKSKYSKGKLIRFILHREKIKSNKKVKEIRNTLVMNFFAHIVFASMGAKESKRRMHILNRCIKNAPSKGFIPSPAWDKFTRDTIIAIERELKISKL